MAYHSSSSSYSSSSSSSALSSRARRSRALSSPHSPLAAVARTASAPVQPSASTSTSATRRGPRSRGHMLQQRAVSLQRRGHPLARASTDPGSHTSLLSPVSSSQDFVRNPTSCFVCTCVCTYLCTCMCTYLYTCVCTWVCAQRNHRRKQLLCFRFILHGTCS